MNDSGTADRRVHSLVGGNHRARQGFNSSTVSNVHNMDGEAILVAACHINSFLQGFLTDIHSRHPGAFLQQQQYQFPANSIPPPVTINTLD